MTRAQYAPLRTLCSAAAVSRIGAEASSSVAGVPRCLPAHFLCRRCGGLARPGSTAARRSRVGRIIAPTLCIVASGVCVPSEATKNIGGSVVAAVLLLALRVNQMAVTPAAKTTKLRPRSLRFFTRIVVNVH